VRREEWRRTRRRNMRTRWNLRKRKEEVAFPPCLPSFAGAGGTATATWIAILDLQTLASPLRPLHHSSVLMLGAALMVVEGGREEEEKEEEEEGEEKDEEAEEEEEEKEEVGVGECEGGGERGGDLPVSSHVSSLGTMWMSKSTSLPPLPMCSLLPLPPPLPPPRPPLLLRLCLVIGFIGN